MKTLIYRVPAAMMEDALRVPAKLASAISTHGLQVWGNSFTHPDTSQLARVADKDGKPSLPRDWHDAAKAMIEKAWAAQGADDTGFHYVLTDEAGQCLADSPTLFGLLRDYLTAGFFFDGLGKTTVQVSYTGDARELGGVIWRKGAKTDTLHGWRRSAIAWLCHSLGMTAKEAKDTMDAILEATASTPEAWLWGFTGRWHFGNREVFSSWARPEHKTPANALTAKEAGETLNECLTRAYGTKYTQHLIAWLATAWACHERPNDCAPISYAIAFVSDRRGCFKSSFAEKILTPLFSSSYVSILSQQNNEGTFNSARVGRRVVVYEEAGLTASQLDTIKGEITGSTMTARELYRAPVTVPREHFTIIITNRMEGLKGMGEDEIRRFLFIDPAAPGTAESDEDETKRAENAAIYELFAKLAENPASVAEYLEAYFQANKTRLLADGRNPLAADPDQKAFARRISGSQLDDSGDMLAEFIDDHGLTAITRDIVEANLSERLSLRFSFKDAMVKMGWKMKEVRMRGNLSERIRNVWFHPDTPDDYNERAKALNHAHHAPPLKAPRYERQLKEMGILEDEIRPPSSRQIRPTANTTAPNNCPF